MLGVALIGARGDFANPRAFEFNAGDLMVICEPLETRGSANF
jgi:hypothetical protein